MSEVHQRMCHADTRCIISQRKPVDEIATKFVHFAHHQVSCFTTVQHQVNFHHRLAALQSAPCENIYAADLCAKSQHWRVHNQK